MRLASNTFHGTQRSLLGSSDGPVNDVGIPTGKLTFTLLLSPANSPLAAGAGGTDDGVYGPELDAPESLAPGWSPAFTSWLGGCDGCVLKRSLYSYCCLLSASFGNVCHTEWKICLRPLFNANP